MEGHSKLLTGILITSFLTVFAIGVGVGLGLSLSLENGNSESTLEQVLKTSPGSGDVPVGLSLIVDGFDTEQGSLEIEEYSDVFDDPIVFPLCVDPSFFANWWAVIKSTGGYAPVTCVGEGIQTFDLYQKDSIVSAPGYYIGYKLTWTLVNDDYKEEGECCSIDYWKVTIDTSCNNLGCLDSNQYPVISGIPGLTMDSSAYNPCGLTIPDKDIEIRILSTWAGCPNENQKFDLILVQKNHVLKVPNSKRI